MRARYGKNDEQFVNELKKKFEYVRNKKVKTAVEEKFIEEFCERLVENANVECNSFEDKFSSKLDDID